MDVSIGVLKQQAKAQLAGNVGMIFIITLVCGFALSISSVLAIFMIGPIILGLTNLYLAVTYGEAPAFSCILEAFKKNFFKSLGLCLIMGLFLYLWSMLFIIPGIVKSYSYSQCFFILSENPDIGIIDCITASRRMMDGYKFRLFVLTLSFILWDLLVIITLGIAGVYVVPYQALTYCDFYHHIKGSIIYEEKQNDMIY